MHISISGNLGSGKSTVCKYLNKKYGIKVYSTGEIQRKLARKNNISTLELNYLMEKDSKYDHIIDDEVTKISQEQKQIDIVFDSRMAWYFAENSFKVLIIVNSNVAAHRVFNATRGKEETYTSIEDAAINLAKRSDVERKRFKCIYHVDYLDFSNYNLVIDSSFCTAENIAELIYREAKMYFDKNNYENKILISPRNLYPSQSIKNISMVRLNEYIKDFCNDFDYDDFLISVVKFNDHFFIVDGHHRTMASIIDSKPFVKVRIIATNADDIVVSNISLKQYLKHVCISDFYDYEDVCNFEYLEYPDLTTINKV